MPAHTTTAFMRFMGKKHRLRGPQPKHNQNSYGLHRSEEAQKAPTEGEELPEDARPCPTLSNRAVTPDGPHLPPLPHTAVCLFPRSQTPAAAAPRCCQAGRARGEYPRPRARPGLPPLPVLLGPTRPRAHQAAAGVGGGAGPGSAAGPAGAEREGPAGSRVLPAGIVTGKT